MMKKTSTFILISSLLIFVSCSPSTSGSTSQSNHPFINPDALHQTMWTDSNIDGNIWAAVRFVKDENESLHTFFGEGSSERTAMAAMQRLGDTTLNPDGNQLTFENYKLIFKSPYQSSLKLGETTIYHNLAKK